METLSSMLLLRASVRGVFSPSELMPATAASQENLAFLAKNSTEQRVRDKWLWTLTAEARQQGLRDLPSDAELRHRFLSQNLPIAGDLLGEMLHRALSRVPDSLAKKLVQPNRATVEPTTEEWVTFLKALDVLHAAQVELPLWISAFSPRAVHRSITLSQRAQSNRALLPDKFRGRVWQRRLLQRFIRNGIEAFDEFAQEGMFDGLEIREQPASSSNTFPAIAVGGIGGSGKSALLSVVREAAESNQDITLIALDFDQPSLRAGDLVALSMEFTRQLGLAEPSIDKRLSELRTTLRQRLAARLSESLGGYEVQKSYLLEMFKECRKLLPAQGRRSMPLVIVADTFEEVLIAGEERVATISDWLGSIRDLIGWQEIRVIIAGRAIDSIFRIPKSQLQIIATVELGDLGLSAGVAKLRDMFKRLGLPFSDFAKPLLEVYGSNPLVIEMLAQYCLGKKRADVETLLAGVESQRQNVQANFAQKFLYSRILERIRVPELQQLAHPGLVLRRVTPELIREVLAGPCKLGPIDEARSRDLLEGLKRQVWLVDPSSTDEVVHRRDVRRLMLPQILLLPSAIEVARAAADWFERHPEISMVGLEVAYYRSLADPSFLVHDEQTLRDLSDYLGPDVEDMPVALRARVKNAGGRKLSTDELANLSIARRRQVVAKRRSKLISEGLEIAVELEDFQPSAGTHPLAISSEVTAPTTDFAILEDAAAAARSVESIQAAFGRCDFTDASKDAAAALASLFRSVLLDSEATASSHLDHPAYLAAIAARLPENNASATAARDFIGRLLNESAAMADLRSAFGNQLQTAHRIGYAAPAILTLGTLGIDQRLFIGVEADRRSPNMVADSTLSWRLHLALGEGNQQRRDAQVIIFPVADPWFMRELNSFTENSDRPIHLNATHKSNARLLAQMSRMVKDRAQTQISDFNWLDDIARDAVVGVRLTSVELPSRVIVGRAPEFYAPARSALYLIDDRAKMADIVQRTTADLPFWPRDLLPGSLTLVGRRRFVPSLVDIADRCGRLGLLLETAAAFTSIPAIRDVDRAYQTFCTTWTDRSGLHSAGSAPLGSVAH